MTARFADTRSLLVLISVVLLAGLTVGPSADGDALADDDSRVTMHRVSVPPAHFGPASDDEDYFNNGSGIWALSDELTMFAPIPYDYPGSSHIFITRVEMLAFDDDPGSRVCLDLWRSEISQGDRTLIGSVCTPLDGSSREVDPLLMDLQVRRVNPGQRAYLELRYAGLLASFHGARLNYTTNP